MGSRFQAKARTLNPPRLGMEQGDTEGGSGWDTCHPLPPPQCRSPAPSCGPRWTRGTDLVPGQSSDDVKHWALPTLRQPWLAAIPVCPQSLSSEAPIPGLALWSREQSPRLWPLASSG